MPTAEQKFHPTAFSRQLFDWVPKSIDLKRDTGWDWREGFRIQRTQMMYKTMDTMASMVSMGAYRSTSPYRLPYQQELWANAAGVDLADQTLMENPQMIASWIAWHRHHGQTSVPVMPGTAPGLSCQ